MKKLFLLILLLPLVSASFINYNIEVLGEKAIVTATMGLEANSPVNSFSTKIGLPENSEILSLRDSKGEIKGFTTKDQMIEFETNSGEKKTRETVELKYEISEFCKGKFTSPCQMDVSLPGFPGSTSSVKITGQRILSFESTPSFTGEIKEKELELLGEGAPSFYAFYSDEGIEFDNFVLFNQSSMTQKEIEEKGLREADSLIEIIPQAIGISLPYKKIPLVVLDTADYEEKLNTYSQGVYMTGGIIVLNRESFNENATAIILHETTHAFNAQAFRWDSSGAAWFDEGAAKLIENYVRELRGERKANLFIGDITWNENNYRYTLVPRGNIEGLISYLLEKNKFMKEWDTSGDTREFGYAFSELYVKEYIKEKGFEELQKAYRELLLIEDRIENRTEFSDKLTEILGKNLTPCKSQKEQEIRDCVKKLNSFEIVLPEKTSVLKLGLNDEEFESVEEKHELKKTILNEKISLFEEKLFGLIGKLFSAIQENKEATK